MKTIATVIAPAAAALACLALVAGGPTARAQEPAPPHPLVERGVALYLELGCGTCHALAAAGTVGPFGPPQDAMAVVAAARVQDASYGGEATDAAGYVRESIVAPRAYLVPGYAATYHKMPAYSFLSDADLDALVALLAGPPEERGD